MRKRLTSRGLTAYNDDFSNEGELLEKMDFYEIQKVLSQANITNVDIIFCDEDEAISYSRKISREVHAAVGFPFYEGDFENDVPKAPLYPLEDFKDCLRRGPVNYEFKRKFRGYTKDNKRVTEDNLYDLSDEDLDDVLLEEDWEKQGFDKDYLISTILSLTSGDYKGHYRYVESPKKTMIQDVYTKRIKYPPGDPNSVMKKLYIRMYLSLVDKDGFVEPENKMTVLTSFHIPKER